MTHRFRFALPALLMLVLGVGLFAAACGGDDDNSNNSGNKDATSTVKSDSTAKTTAKSGNGGATGSDQEFVSGMCKAAKTFVDKLTADMDKMTPSATAESLDDLGKFFEAFFGNLAPAFEQFAKDFRNLKPPKDLKEWHTDAAAKMDAAAKALKDGKFDDPALQDLGGSTIPEIPKDINDRLEKIAQNNKDCKELDAFSQDSGGLFGGLGSDLATPTPKK